MLARDCVPCQRNSVSDRWSLMHWDVSGWSPTRTTPDGFRRERVELKADGMIWLYVNYTDIEIGQNLIGRGVDPQHIEISWIEPTLRRLMEAAKEGR